MQAHFKYAFCIHLNSYLRFVCNLIPLIAALTVAREKSIQIENSIFRLEYMHTVTPSISFHAGDNQVRKISLKITCEINCHRSCNIVNCYYWLEFRHIDDIASIIDWCHYLGCSIAVLMLLMVLIWFLTAIACTHQYHFRRIIYGTAFKWYASTFLFIMYEMIIYEHEHIAFWGIFCICTCLFIKAKAMPKMAMLLSGRTITPTLSNRCVWIEPYKINRCNCSHPSL